MVNLHRTGRWAGCLVAVAIFSQDVVQAASQSRNLNPYHEQQLESQIRKCASGVLACSDAEQKALKQQELCQLLVRAERFDEALQVSYNIYKSEPAASERRATYHFMVAEIYNRKMKHATTTSDMEACRRSALSAAQEVLQQNYPAKWRVSEYARDLIRDLNDSASMQRVRQRVASRQGHGGDATKEAIADAQRKYLDATQGRTAGISPAPSAQQSPRYMRVSQPQPSETTAMASLDGLNSVGQVHGRASFSDDDDNLPSLSGRRPAASGSSRSAAAPAALPSEPQVTRVLSSRQAIAPTGGQIGSRLSQTGLLTSQPGATETVAVPGSRTSGLSLNAAEAQAATLAPTAQTIRQPILVNGAPANQQHMSVDEVVQNNLAQLLEDARRRKANEASRSPYATGQLPQTNAR